MHHARDMRAALTYFVYANLVFWSGVTGHLDDFGWGILSFAGYFPASLIVQTYIAIPLDVRLGWREQYIVLYVTDVCMGTLWWFAIATAWHKWMARKASQNSDRY
jgi:hypothetical protein